MWRRTAQKRKEPSPQAEFTRSLLRFRHGTVRNLSGFLSSGNRVLHWGSETEIKVTSFCQHRDLSTARAAAKYLPTAELHPQA
jgi:hypothetical protein